MLKAYSVSVIVLNVHVGGYGGWSSEGCITINSGNISNGSNNEVTCLCDHLTNFAILLVSHLFRVHVLGIHIFTHSGYVT